MSLLEYPLYANLPHAFWLIFIFFGATLGSFFNVLALRWPGHQIFRNNQEAKTWLALNNAKVTGLSDTRPLPLMSGRSQCPCCKKPIALYHNIPLVSWLLLRGRSACCQKPIRVIYLAMELLGALTFAVVALAIGPTVFGLVTGIVVMLLLLMARIDAVEGFVPDALLFVTTTLAYLLALSSHGIGAEQALIAHLCTFFGLYCVFQSIGWLIKSEAMGMADYHLFGIAAVLLGSQVGWVFAVLIPMLIITQLCKSLSKWQPGVFARLVGAKALPAGPAIVASTLLVMVLKLYALIP